MDRARDGPPRPGRRPQMNGRSQIPPTPTLHADQRPNIHELPGQSLTGITWVEDDATTTITYVQTRIVAMPGQYFLPRQRQLDVWTQIGFGIVNE